MDRGYVVERKTHPKDAAGIWSLLTFSYIHPYVKKGNKRDLNEDDICKVWTKLRSKQLGDKIEKVWNDQNTKKGKKKGIFKLMCECFLKRYLLLGCLQLFAKLFYVIFTPYSVGKLVNYFKEGQTEVSKNEAWMYGAIVMFTNSFFLLYEHHYILLKSEFGMDIIASFSSLIYRKALKLSPSKFAEISSGRIVTAITKDISQIEEAFYFINDLWVESIQAIVVLYLLYIKLGPSGITGLSIVVVLAVIQVYIGKVLFKKRQDANSKSDERLQLTQEIITAIRVLKMYSWEDFFAKKIIDARKSEICKIRTLCILRFTTNFLGALSTKLSFLFILLFYIWFGNSLSAEIVYYVTTCFYRLRRTIAFIIPVCCASIAEMAACLSRIEVILNAEEIEHIVPNDSSAVITPKVDFVAASMGVGNVRILRDINMKLRTGLNVLIGPVGCGKSSLIKGILREYAILDGKANIEGTISYCPQNPWVFPSSIKQNILFGQPYNETKYQTILEACALSFDLSGLAEGDETILNDCGVNLSKGQQARVNIARALYKDSDIYIFDDALSALDSHVKTYIFNYSILNYLKNKLVVLATHDTKFVDKAENVIIMLDRTVTYSGKPKDIPSKLSQSLESLDKDLNESDEENDLETKEVEDEKPCNEDTELVAKMCSSTKANVYHETIISGGIGWKDYKKYFMFGGGFSVFFVVFLLFLLLETLSGYSEKFLSKWVSLEEKIDIHTKNVVLNSTTVISELYSYSYSTYAPIDYGIRNETTEEIISSSMSTIWSNLSSSKMTNMTESLEFLLIQRNFYVNWYSILLVASSVLAFAAMAVYFIFSLKISKNLHKSMITNVLGATMSFFDVNMSGNIINRFSKDLYSIDEWIPYIISEAMRILIMMVITGMLIASINISFTIMTAVLVCIFFLACRYFVRPGRTLRRLDMATRSPLVGHLNATLDGLITIRAYGTQSVLINEFDKHQDHYVATHHLFEIMIRCLAFSLHGVSAVYISMIILRFLIQGDSSSNVGLAITQSFVLSNFLDWGLRQWVMLESIMTSFQRTAQYTDVQQESRTGQIIKNWPAEGCIKYQNVNLTYREKNETVLRNLNFTIQPSEKIGIVGRTGAGKSSIIVTLFRLYEIEGKILIDDVDIKTLSLDHLRNNIAIIPQDPILFEGSVRSNIDPLKKYGDNEIWQALSAVNLKCEIMDLDEDIHKSGITYSVGQRQLLCLARAIVRKTKIIILDEATANMDEETDHFIHNKINELFKDCTTITVAHRLHSVMRCDKVIVMDRGEVVEYESPHTLLENKDSMFYKMAHHHDNS
ncbi:hypothetical protein HHI36_005337 [Cryptolaemus montrouzieri]|uniref:Uncharacterized protein n=1 Tax=Cryptolaemus montrouzieri TaxID=559131 RepID=A0ABD2NTT9_9CUCU